MRILFLLSILVCFSCNTNSKRLELKITIPLVTKPSEGFSCHYDKQKENGIRAQNIKDFDDREKYITSLIIDSLIPCWYGTPWDFNGTTETPGTGKIACGYFVTTVIRDAGLPVERIKMAQCPSEEMIETLCRWHTIKRFSNQPLATVLDSIKKSGIGIYITGLDNHTGFIYNGGKEIYFIHSSYIPPKCVLKEKAISSSILYYSKYRVVGKLKI